MEYKEIQDVQGVVIRRCARCGDPEESINHVFFECPPARQAWALSKIPLNPNIFPVGSIFADMDHLFWRVNPKIEDHHRGSSVCMDPMVHLEG